MTKQSYMPPQTSLQAHNRVKERNQKVTHAHMILQVLSVIKEGNYVEISKASWYPVLTPLRVERRLSEMVRDGLIRKTGTRLRTSTETMDMGEVYCIIEDKSDIPFSKDIQQLPLFAA